MHGTPKPALMGNPTNGAANAWIRSDVGQALDSFAGRLCLVQHVGQLATAGFSDLHHPGMLQGCCKTVLITIYSKRMPKVDP